MPLRVGLVGLPNVGKTTLFNAVTRAGAMAANFPFTTIEPNVGVVPVPDRRLEHIASIAGSARWTPVTFELIDVAGLVEGASRGEGLGNRFLGVIREVDAVCHVVRCFDDPDVAHVVGGRDPVRDVEIVRTELLLKDLETVERRLEEARRDERVGKKEAAGDVTILERLAQHLSDGADARQYTDGERSAALIDELFLLTRKPVLVAANVSEDSLPDGGAEVDALRDALPDTEVVVVCADLEAELLDLAEPERVHYLREAALEDSGLERLVTSAYRTLGLITFFTANEREAHAWTVRESTRVQDAVGQVHTDMQRGFVRAEVIGYDELAELGSIAAAREAGRLRVEGRDYRVVDGDLVEVRFTA